MRILFSILTVLSTALFTSCKKDEPVPVSPANNLADISNLLIAGGGTSSFQRLWGGEKNDVFYGIRQTPDNGYIICGSTENAGAGATDIVLVKTDAEGSTLWMKTYGTAYNEDALAIDITGDGGYVVTGLLTVPHQPAVSFIFKTSSTGELLWQAQPEYEIYLSGRSMTNGNTVVCGKEGKLLSLNSSGERVWKIIVDPGSTLFSIDETSSGNIVVCGHKQTSQVGDILLALLDNNGDSLWTRTYGDNTDNVAQSVKALPDGKFIVTGYNSTTAATAGFVMLLDSAGSEIWEQPLPGLDIPTSINLTNDNNFIVAGFNASDTKALIVKVSANGSIIWSREYDLGTMDRLQAIIPTADGGFASVGFTWPTPAKKQGYFVKTDANGN